MAFHPLDLAKKHPVLLGVGVFAVGLVLVLMLSGGSTTPTQPTVYAGTGVDPSTVAANTALTQSQLAAGVANQQTAAQLQTNLAGFAAQTTQASLQNNTDNLALNLQSTVALAQIQAQKDTQSMVSQLSASVSNAQIAAQASMNENNNSTQTQIAKISADMQTTQGLFLKQIQESANARDITINGQNSAAMTALAATYANTTIQTQQIAAGVQTSMINSAERVQAGNIMNEYWRDHNNTDVQLAQVAAQSKRDEADAANARSTADQNIQLQHAELFQRAYANQYSINNTGRAIPF